MSAPALNIMPTIIYTEPHVFVSTEFDFVHLGTWNKLNKFTVIRVLNEVKRLRL